jgi:hypothetical protein
MFYSQSSPFIGYGIGVGNGILSIPISTLASEISSLRNFRFKRIKITFSPINVELANTNLTLQVAYNDGNTVIPITDCLPVPINDPLVIDVPVDPTFWIPCATSGTNTILQIYTNSNATVTLYTSFDSTFEISRPSTGLILNS